jgi:c-di-GMP-binding flagellar brake protein YcgR
MFGQSGQTRRFFWPACPVRPVALLATGYNIARASRPLPCKLAQPHRNDLTIAMNTSTKDNENIAQMPLKDLGLRPGMALQTRRMVEGASKKESQFFGAIESKGVMVGPQGPDGEKTELQPGEVCIVRGFTGQHEFSFLSKVLDTFEKPFAYALLAYPAQVDAKLVRRSMRTKTSWPTTVQTLGKDGTATGQVVEAMLVDISMQGAMINSPSSLATVGDTIKVTILAVVEEVQTSLTLSAAICHNNKSKTGENYFVGMAFKNVSQQDKLVLHYLTTTPHA